LTLGQSLRGFTLAVRAGEIVGIAGVDGNGQDALVRVLAGLERPGSGVVRVGRVEVVHPDRDRDGLVVDAPVGENLMLGEYALFGRMGIVSDRALEREASERARRAKIVPADLRGPVRTLSGGNRQRLVVARAMARAERADAFVFAQPTQGVDFVGAAQIHEEIRRAAIMGKAVLVVSSDLAELRLLSQRVAVMVRGRVVAELPPGAPEARFGEAMLGSNAISAAGADA
jgi:simple sugar transport system ATP-binding protein